MSTANKQQFTDADAFQLRRIKLQMNKHEWSEPLDKFLQECVVRNYFNFDLIAMEVSTEAQNLGHLVGATNAYTSEKCRFRWSYLHLKVSSARVFLPEFLIVFILLYRGRRESLSSTSTIQRPNRRPKRHGVRKTRRPRMQRNPIKSNRMEQSRLEVPRKLTSFPPSSKSS